MINKYLKNSFNYINYFTLACIIPIGYFAPIGEWLLLSLISIATLIKTFVNNDKINLNNLLIFIFSIIVICISYFWSINPNRTFEVIGPISGIIIAIFISLNMTAKNKVFKIDNVIGIPLLIISVCIFLDMKFNTEIRSSLALLVGDEPTSRSANFGRGIIILMMIMPFSVALYLNSGKIFLALSVLILVSVIVIIGPNHSAKIALLIAILSALIIYFLGPRSFLYFGLVSIIFILLLPIISTKLLPAIGNIEKNNYYDTPWQKTALGGSIIHRLLVWEFVGNEISNKPLKGHGAGTSRMMGQNIILNVPNTKQEIKGGIPLHPHNNFLEIWLELGLLGIITIIILWAKIIQYGVKMRKESYIIGTGICSSIVTIFIISNLSFGVFQAWWMSSIALIFLVIFQSNNNKNINS